MNKHIFKTHFKAYLDKGLSVIPDRYQGKTPLIKDWTRWCDERPSEDQCQEWVSSFKETNIALALGKASGIIALDLDTIRQDILDIIYPMLPFSPVVKIGSKGETRFFRFMGEHTQKVTFQKECIIEVLSTGKKTTIPPSVHPNGSTYKDIGEKTLLEIDVLSLPILPPMLISQIESVLRSSFGSELESGKSGSLSLKDSGRNNTLSSLVGRLIAERVDLNESIKTLIETDKKQHSPPLFTDVEEGWLHTEAFTNALTFYTSHLNNVNKKHFRQNDSYEVPIMPVAINSELKEEERLGKSQHPEKEKRSKQGLPDAQGAMKIIQSYLLENSYAKQPAYALSGAIAIISTVLGRRFTFNGSAPAMYQLLTSASGSGKSTALEPIDRVLGALNLSSLSMAGDYTSGGALMDSLEYCPERLDILDEASTVLAKVTNKGATDHTANMSETFCKLWSASNGIFKGRATASRDKDTGDAIIKGSCYRPSVNMLWATTPEGIRDTLTLSDIRSGFLARFFILKGLDKPETVHLITPTKLNKDVVAKLSHLRDATIETNDNYIHGGSSYPVKEVTLQRGLESLYSEYYKRFEAETKDATPHLLPVLKRFAQQFNKLALIHAAGRANMSIDFKINKMDLDFAYEMCIYNIVSFENLVENHMFETPRDKEYKSVITHITEFHDGEASTKDLFSHFRKYVSRKRFDDILNDLNENEELSFVSFEDGTRGVKI